MLFDWSGFVCSPRAPTGGVCRSAYEAKENKISGDSPSGLHDRGDDDSRAEEMTPSLQVGMQERGGFQLV